MLNLLLTVSHSIFLKREDVYNLYNLKEIEVIGVNTPVWLNGPKDMPLPIEVFVKYKLNYTKEDPLIKHHFDGYEINLPIETENTEHPCIKDLLDSKDGGSEFVAFKQKRKLRTKNNKEFNIIHFVQIKRIEELEETMLITNI